MKVAVFVGTRADLGPLHAGAGGARIATRCGDDRADRPRLRLPRALAERLGRPVSSIVQLAEPLHDVDLPAQLLQGPALSLGAGRLAAQAPVDRLVVLGDRWELLYVVPPFVLAGVPVVHLHGGEVTGGRASTNGSGMPSPSSPTSTAWPPRRRGRVAPARRAGRADPRHRGAWPRPIPRRGATQRRRARGAPGRRRVERPARPVHLPPADGVGSPARTMGPEQACGRPSTSAARSSRRTPAWTAAGRRFWPR